MYGADARPRRALRASASAVLGMVFSIGFSSGPLPYEGVLSALALAAFATLWITSPTKRGAAGLTWLFAAGYFGAGLFWVVRSMHLFGGLPMWMALAGWALLASGLALFPVAASVVSKPLASRSPWAAATSFAVAWALLDFVRGHVFPDFGWLETGYAAVSTPLLSLASYGGSFAMSLALLTGAFWTGTVFASRCTSMRTLAAGLVSLFVWAGACAWLAGLWQKTPGPAVVPESGLWVRAVQPQLPLISFTYRPSDASRLASVAPLVSGAWPADAKPGHRLLLTPEGLLGRPFRTDDLPSIPGLYELRRAAAAPVVLSGFRVEGRRIHNTAFLWEGDRVFKVDKRDLVPFGEYVPSVARPLVDALGIPMQDLSAGSRGQPLFEAGGLRIGMLICYENLYGGTVRSFFNGSSPDLIVLTSNLAWFGPGIRGQQLQMARVRAVEAGRPVVSVSNDGPTAWIDHRGGVLERLSDEAVDTMTLEAYRLEGAEPLYVRAGERYPLLAAALLLLISWIVCFSKKARWSRVYNGQFHD